MNLKSLRKQALSNELEVEDILRAAKRNLPGLAEELERLTLECGWSDGGRDGPNLIIPFRKWALTAAAYSRGGIAELSKLASDASFLPFVLALLDELHSREALLALLDLLAMCADSDVETASRFAQSINMCLSFRPVVIVGPAEEESLRLFLHGLLARELSHSQRAVALCALREVGDESSLALVRERSLLGPPWSGLEMDVISRIKKHIRAQNRV
jgi:hypothetical protein